MRTRIFIALLAALLGVLVFGPHGVALAWGVPPLPSRRKPTGGWANVASGVTQGATAVGAGVSAPTSTPPWHASAVASPSTPSSPTLPPAPWHQPEAVQRPRIENKAKESLHPRLDPQEGFAEALAKAMGKAGVTISHAAPSLPPGSPTFDPKAIEARRMPAATPNSAAPNASQLVARLKQAVAQGTPREQIQGPLTSGQKIFGETLAQKTGLSPHVVAAWELAENSDANAVQKDAQNYHNWLNIGPFLQSPRFDTPQGGGKATAKFLEGKLWGAGANIPSIVTTAGKSDAEQMRAIENSGFSATGYGAGGTLNTTYSQVDGRSRPAQPLPQHLVNRAQDVLGKQRTQRIIQGGGTGSASSGGPKPLPEQQLTRWLQPTESASEIAGELGVKTKRANIEITKLDPAFQRALVAVAKESGQPIGVNEGFRTRYRQEQLASGAGGATGPAAAPGTSEHEFGRAADLEMTPQQVALLSKHGLSNNVVPGEPWHVQLADSSAYAQAPASAAGSASYGAAPSSGGSVSAGAGLPPALGGGTSFDRGKTRVGSTGSMPTPLAFAAHAVTPAELQAAKQGDANTFASLLAEAYRRRLHLSDTSVGS
jgi:hypothetical protein